MLEFKNKTEEYIHEVCNQIRWKKAHSNISEELKNHIDDQIRAFIKGGQNRSEAEKNAIAEMGDAVIVGQQLDRTHRPKPEWSIVAIISICILISLVAQYIISINAAKFGSIHETYFWDYVKILPIGLGILFSVYFADYSILGKYPKTIYGLTLSACVLLFGINSLQRFGSYLHVFYFALLLMVLYAGIVYNLRNKGYKGLLFCGFVGVVTDLVLVMSSITPALMFTISGAILLTVAIKKNWYQVNKKIGLMLVWLPMVCLFVLLYLFRSGRYGLVFNVDDKMGFGWILMVVRNILKGSQFIGRGNISNPLNAEIEKNLPAWYNDYSLVYFIDKFGWIVGLIAVILVALFLIRLFTAVKKQTSGLGYIISLSVAITISVQCVIFLSSNLGLSYIGCPLPLLSYGRMSFLVNMGLLGLLLSAYRNNDVMREIIVLNSSPKRLS